MDSQLKTLLLIRSGLFRQKDIAEARGRAKSTVFRQVEILVEKGLVEKGQGGFVALTDCGWEYLRDKALIREGGKIKSGVCELV